MTDAELIARLNRWIEQQVLVLVDSDLLPIRDRIEALTEQLAAAQDDAKEAEAYAEELEADRKKTYEALLKVSRIHGEVEAKLAKAVEALLTIVDNGGAGSYHLARNTLKEIKGESHD